MGQKRQGGSTIGYVLIGIVLVGMLVGGVYALRRLMNTKPSEVATQSQKEQDKSNQDQQPTSTEQKSEQTASDGVQGENLHSDAGQSSTSNRTTASVELPKTGPSSIVNLLVLGLLAAVIAGYVQSRRVTL